MWRAHTARQGRQILNAAKRHYAAEPGQAPPPPRLPKPATGPPRSSKSSTLLKFLGLNVIAGGGIAGYAWYDPDFRKQVEVNVPYSKELLDQILPASDTAAPPIKETPPIAPALDVALPPPIFETSKVKEEPKPEKVPEPPVVAKSQVKNYDWINWIMTTAKCSQNDEFDITSEKLPTNSGPLMDTCFYYYYPTMDRENKNKKNKTKEYGDLSGETSCSGEETEGDSVDDDKVNMENTEDLTAEVERMLQEKINKDFIEEKKPEPQVVSNTAVQLASETKTKKPEVEIDLAEAMKSREEREREENAALELSLHKLLARSESIIEETVKAQNDVVAHTRTHVKLLRHAMDDEEEILNKDEQWEAVAVAFKEKENSAFRSAELVAESKKSIEKIQEMLASCKQNSVTKTNPAILPATKKVVQLTNLISSANAQVRQAESEARVMLKYKDLVDRGRKQFQQELESLMPDVKLGVTNKKLSEDELNALIAHAHRRIEQLRKQLAEQMSMERQRLSRALEAQRVEDQANTMAAVADERLRSQNEFETEKHKMELDFMIRQENEVRKQLGRQAAAHSDHIKDVLAVQREQLSLEFNRELNARILEEREKFQTEVSSWISRLKGIETAVDSRAASEHLARCAQDLWLACIALNSVIHYGIDDEPEKRVPVKKEVDAVLKVGNKHPFVETVVNTLPKAALERGVHTEEALRNRFLTVSRVCRRVGLVNESNSSLFQFLISFGYSLVALTGNVRDVTPASEVDLNDLDNYGLVAYAQHFMTQGDLESAVKFMCQLTGESRVAASDWINEAKLLLETRQVASSLQAFASATGLANTF